MSRLRDLWEEKKSEFPNWISIFHKTDGNGRWAKLKEKPRAFGHINGANNVEELTRFYGRELAGIVNEVSYWYKSVWNVLNRPREENLALQMLLRERQKSLISLADDAQARIVPFGDYELWTRAERKTFDHIENQTQKHWSTHLSIGIAAGYSQSLFLAKTLWILQSWNPQFLNLSPEDRIKLAYETMHKGLRLPDLFILAGDSDGKRTSDGFCGPNTHIYATPTLWPDVNWELVTNAIIDMLEHTKIKNGAVK